MTEYIRTFVLQACHFNDAATYNAHEDSMVAARDYDYVTAYEKLHYCALHSHGHNFIVTVRCVGLELAASHCQRGESSWLVEDAELEATVQEWNNINLSLHDDFSHARATTENMARILSMKLSRRMGRGVGFEVTVEETPDVVARHVVHARHPDEGI